MNKRLKKNSNFKTRAEAHLDVMSKFPAFSNDVHKQNTCSIRNPCRRFTCLHCGFNVDRKPKPKHPHWQPTQEPKRKYQKNGKRCRQAIFAKAFTEFFNDVPEEELIPITINFFYAHPDIDLMTSGASWRAYLKQVLQKKLPEARLLMNQDIAQKHTSSIPDNYPADAVDPALGNHAATPMPTFLLHAHGIIWHPFLSAEKIRKILKKSFRGDRRVCIGVQALEELDNKGEEFGGITGWMEYSALEKTELDYEADNAGFTNDEIADATTGPWDNVRVFAALAKARKAWKRQSRWIKFKGRSAKQKHTGEVLRGLRSTCSPKAISPFWDHNVDHATDDKTLDTNCQVYIWIRSPRGRRASDNYQAKLPPAKCLKFLSFSFSNDLDLCSRPGIDRPP